MNYLGLQCQEISVNLKGAALRTKVYVNTNVNEIGVSMFQGKYQASADVNEKPSWTKVINNKTKDWTKDKIIWHHQFSSSLSGWRIGDGKLSALYTYGNESFPYDKEIQWYYPGVTRGKRRKVKPNEVDVKCTMKAGELFYVKVTQIN